MSPGAKTLRLPKRKQSVEVKGKGRRYLNKDPGKTWARSYQGRGGTCRNG